MNNNLTNFKTQVLSLQVTRALEIKAQRGDFPGRPPIGYTNDTNTKQIIPDLKSWSIVKEALEKYTTGKFIIGWITKFLNENLPSIKWGERKPLIKSRVEAILCNPFYFGEFVFRGRTYLGKHKPMIAKEAFGKIQGHLKGGKM